MIKQLEDLGKTEIQIRAVGNYPTKQKTKVQDVAHYQNDGTERIKPARFVEKAERKHRAWLLPLQRAVGRYLDGRERALAVVSRKMAEDINKSVNRIKTGRLRESFRSIFHK